ncbi:polyphosphate kinase 2 family protein [Algoriphagus halophytocola]|uniref:Polyphosphate kinase 2 family protein n=1 Tax=Algoriphagus halophytocola TaxID=2991499 RepID=A0ABY6MI81_9BACT|nr:MULTISPECIES: PPK2 family polyphosphate kinase [unclassified Algoriphagus]UZD23328.1 polyphosphate kinase 2 family protein [Algoriphagus sp. TR-M5]WBL44623.1 polyphosphate kinase 2 family protein [Algoriphagus sp. TR-M9]
MKKIAIDDFKVTGTISLKDIPTALDLEASEKKKAKALNKLREKLSDHQDTMYAHNKYSVLICLQGMDTAGKDSLIREVFKEFNPRGVVVHSFKTPSTLELEHGFLWRHYIRLPERGKYAVFNRTHYENVLVTRVHPVYILGENIPGIDTVDDIKEGFWEKRFEQINNFEKEISENGTIILKFFLHLGKEEQRHRLLRRLNKEKHNWKFSPGDLKERERWDDYQRCYEEAINKTSKPHAPWFIIPSDNKETARVLVAKAILEKVKELKAIQEPQLDDEVKRNIEMYKEILSKPEN